MHAAGQRVQVIRRDRRKGGVLEFSTTVVNSADGSIAGLLGGSPGASTAVPIMLDVLLRTTTSLSAKPWKIWAPSRHTPPSIIGRLSAS